MEVDNDHCNANRSEFEYIKKRSFTFYIQLILKYIYFKCFFSKVSEWLLLNANSAFFQLYNGENKLIFNEMRMGFVCTRPTRLHIYFLSNFFIYYFVSLSFVYRVRVHINTILHTHIYIYIYAYEHGRSWGSSITEERGLGCAFT
jgi:hypothetical protein